VPLVACRMLHPARNGTSHGFQSPRYGPPDRLGQHALLYCRHGRQTRHMVNRIDGGARTPISPRDNEYYSTKRHLGSYSCTTHRSRITSSRRKHTSTHCAQRWRATTIVAAVRVFPAWRTRRAQCFLGSVCLEATSWQACGGLYSLQVFTTPLDVGLEHALVSVRNSAWANLWLPVIGIPDLYRALVGSLGDTVC
jgi:hypothetical protein